MTRIHLFVETDNAEAIAEAFPAIARELGGGDAWSAVVTSSSYGAGVSFNVTLPDNGNAMQSAVEFINKAITRAWQKPNRDKLAAKIKAATEGKPS